MHPTNPAVFCVLCSILTPSHPSLPTLLYLISFIRLHLVAQHKHKRAHNKLARRHANTCPPGTGLLPRVFIVALTLTYSISFTVSTSIPCSSNLRTSLLRKPWFAVDPSVIVRLLGYSQRYTIVPLLYCTLAFLDITHYLSTTHQRGRPQPVIFQNIPDYRPIRAFSDGERAKVPASKAGLQFQLQLQLHACMHTPDQQVIFDVTASLHSRWMTETEKKSADRIGSRNFEPCPPPISPICLPYGHLPSSTAIIDLAHLPNASVATPDLRKHPLGRTTTTTLTALERRSSSKSTTTAHSRELS